MPRRVDCAACGRAFGCGVQDGECWCAEVEVGAAARERLAAEYGDCLCPACLREAADDAPLRVELRG